MPTYLLSALRLKVASPFEQSFFDPLYGETHFEAAIADLATRPLVQRLRRIRLSNIDSLASPGISNISRYEHSLGTAVLAAHTPFASRADAWLRISFIATALMHDTGITPFGHLMEEALSYSRADYHHENIWSELLHTNSTRALGGVNLQLYLGFQSGLRDWAEKFFGANSGAAIEEIAKGVNGKGAFGAAIVGGLDLDNLDNVARAAFHIGLPVDRKMPLSIAGCLEHVDERGALFADEVVDTVNSWLALREQVYSRFMLPRADFSGKLMLLFAMVQGLKYGALSENDRNLTDDQLLAMLSSTQDKQISTAIRRWLIADLWDISDLVWFDGKLPTFHALDAYATELSSAFSRQCFAYRIKDKRKRRLELKLVSGGTVTLGESPSQWLLGAGSPTKKAFTAKENRTMIQIARKHFDAELAVGAALFA
jgi:uncharacterized protein